MDFLCKKVASLTSDDKLIIAHIIAESRNAFSTPIHIPSVEQVKLSSDAPFGPQQLILLYLQLFLIQIRRSQDNPNEQKTIPLSLNTQGQNIPDHNYLNRY